MKDRESSSPSSQSQNKRSSQKLNGTKKRSSHRSLEILISKQHKQRLLQQSNAQQQQSNDQNHNQMIDIMASKSAPNGGHRNNNNNNNNVNIDPNRPSLKQSGTSLVAADEHQRNQSGSMNSINVSQLNFEESVSGDIGPHPRPPSPQPNGNNGNNMNGNNNNNNRESLRFKHFKNKSSSSNIIKLAKDRNSNNMNVNKNNMYDNKNGSISIEIIMPSSSSGIQRCVIHIRSDQTLLDLKQLVSTSLNHFDSSNLDYVFYHNHSGVIFTNNNLTIKQCIAFIGHSEKNHGDLSTTLSLKIGLIKGSIPTEKKLPPPPIKKRSSLKSKPAPPSNKKPFHIQSNSKENMNKLDENLLDYVPQRRKSTKLDVVKSKIAIEMNKNFKEIMTYIKDSPFWWKKMNEGIDRVKRLTTRLKSIASLIQELCTLLKKFSTHCNKISGDVMKSWEDIENEFSGDVLSLNAQFFNLGDTINTLSTASMMLSHTLEKVIVDEFNQFAEHHLNQLMTSNKELISMKSEYETSLQSVLHNKQGNGENSNDNMYIIKKNRCESLRKQYELKRFDHCIILNNIINRHRYDIILNLCAAFCGFETFFHIGYEASLSHKQFHHSIRVGLSEKDKKQKEYFDRIVNKNRQILVDVLNQGKDYNDYKQKIKPASLKKNAVVQFKNVPQVSDKNEYVSDSEDDHKNAPSVNMDKGPSNDDSDSDDDEMGFISKKDRERFKHVSLDYYDGYLWKQSSKSKRKWQKRWFVLTNGELEYFRNEKNASLSANNRVTKQKSVSSPFGSMSFGGSSSKSVHKEYIGNTALCKVKKAVDHDYKFVFEIITPTRRTYALQAQTANEYDEWFYVLSNQCARLLLRKNTIDRFRKKHNEATQPLSYAVNDQNNWIKQEKERIKKEIFSKNKFCADCGKSNPEWCSINIGVILCVNCCGVHRGLGTHISKMRSLKLDDLSITTLKCILNLGGNDKMNKLLLECNLSSFENENNESYKKIDHKTCSQIQRSNFIKNKYTFKMFIAHHQQNGSDTIDFNQLLWNAVANNDFFGVIKSLYYGADVNYQFIKYNNRTVIHEAVERNYTEMVLLLVNNEAQASIEDGDEKKPNEIAIQQSLNNIDNTEIQNILKTAVY